MQYPPYLTNVKGASASQSGSSQVTFDYSGLEDYAKRRDLLPQAQSQKFSALYAGDIGGAVASQHRIRDLLDSIKNPRQPMVRIASASTSGDSSSDSGSIAGTHPSIDMPTEGGRAAAPIRENANAPQVNLPQRTRPGQRRLSRQAPVTDVLGEPRNNIAGMA